MSERAAGDSAVDTDEMVEMAGNVGENDLEQLTSLFRLLSERTRLAILMELAKGERNVTSLCDELKLPQPTVSHHLSLLRMNNVVVNRRSGKQVYYGLHTPPTSGANLLEFIVEKLCVNVTARP